jgi:hypothetical protein
MKVRTGYYIILGVVVIMYNHGVPLTSIIYTFFKLL